MNAWSKRSKTNLETCHKDIQTIAEAVLQIHDCTVICGHRDELYQDMAYNSGNSKVQWPNSKHNSLPSTAVDLAPYKKGHDPYDMEDVLYFAGIVMATAEGLHRDGLIEHRLKWGGTWSVLADAPFAFDRMGFFDGIHFELVI